MLKGGMDVMKMFKQLDQNGDGKITEEDFCHIMQKVGLGHVGDMVAKQVFKQIDTNHNGKLDTSEAMRAFEKLSELARMSGKSHQPN